MPTQTPQPVFVLVRPQLGENIGAAARAMWNFGLERMRLVAPRDGWPNPAADAMASGAGRLLDAARPCADLAEAVADCHHVLATSARIRGLTKPVLTPEQAMADAAARIGAGQRVAVLFGPERSGLENSDVAQANALVSVPVNAAFPSLNLAQCVLICAYEWRRACLRTGPAPARDAGGAAAGAQAVDAPAGGAASAVHMAGAQWATQEEIARLAQHYEERLTQAGFFFPESKAESMRVNLRNLWSRMPLTQADVRMLHGVLRQMVRWKTPPP